MAERIILASPREPCGATWLINCLLVLGVKTYRVGPGGQEMWIKGLDGVSLDPRENILKQWLPVLSQRDNFEFGDQIEVQWLHEWPTDADWKHRVLYFIRDPRDAMYSRYRREGSTLAFNDYLAFPDAFSLLEKVDHWRLFNESWIAHPNLKVVRFEDYKADALQTLRQAIAWLGLTRAEGELVNAIENSSFEKAAQAERHYLRTMGSAQVINRAGKPGEWHSLAGEVDAMAEISTRCASVLRHFGYAAPVTTEHGLGYRSQFTHLKHFASVRLAVPLIQPAAGEDLGLQSLVARLDPQLFKAAGVSDSEAHVMLNSLSEYARAAGWQRSLTTLKALYDVMGIKRVTWWSIQKSRFREALKKLVFMAFPGRGVS
jgi:hypothetical protein